MGESIGTGNVIAASIRSDAERRLPSIAVVDLVPIRRSGTVAALASQGFTGIISSDLVSNIANDQIFEVIVLVCGKQDFKNLVDANLAQIRARYAGSKIFILLDGHVEDFAEVLANTPLACDAVLDSRAEARILRSAIQLIDGGFKVFPNTLSSAVPADTLANRPHEGSLLPMLQIKDLLEKSTARQREVIQLLVMGLSNKEIGQRLAISDSTVKAHIRSIMELFEVRNRTQIVSRLALALQHDGHSDWATSPKPSADPASRGG